MSKCSLTLAFDDDPDYVDTRSEICRILRELARWVEKEENLCARRTVRDINGNQIGRWSWDFDDEDESEA
jgi:hypothetical protein